jgi:Bacterial SH3 domain
MPAMAKSDRPLTVDIPGPGSDRPAWSRVGIIGVAGFVLGMAWPKLAGVKIGPAVPADLRAQVDPGAPPPGSATAATRARPSGSASTGASAAASASASADADPDVPPPNQEMVVIGPGRIVKCSDKKDKKIEDCEKLLFDPIAVKRLRELSRCPSALGLTGKLTVGFEVDFKKKEVGVKKSKRDKTSLPSSTVSGILQCAAKEFGNVSLEEVPHKHRSYTLEYVLSFYGPGKHPDAPPSADPGGDGEPSAGSTTSEADASGSAVVAWDTALLRKEPKDGEVVARLVRGTKVKILGKQSDWYKIESGSKTGWVYRGTIGL